MSGDREIRRLREEIADVDREIVDAIARRMSLSERMGHLKAREGLEIEAKEIEAAVLARARERGRALDLDEDLLEELFGILIEYSKREQRRCRGVGKDRDAGT